MDWSHELLASLKWLISVFFLSLIGLSIIVAALVRFTQWGRQFKRIAWPYFRPSRSKLPLVWVSVIMLMTLFGVRLDVLFSFWYNGFYTSMQNLDSKAFWFMLAVFSILAAVHVGRSLLNIYLSQAFLIGWRKALTDTMLEKWLARQSYYRSEFVAKLADNPDQRIAQDVDSFVSMSLKLTMGLLSAVVSLCAFTLILWNLSSKLELLGVEIPRAMVFMSYLYVIVATVFAVKIGRPLERLNFLNEQFSANFRYALIRVREYAESIAFYRGEAVERHNLLTRFADVIGNMWAILFRSLKFQGFNLVVSQAAVVFPFIVQAPRLFSKQITLGDVMQTAQAFGQVQDSLSFFRSSYDDFASYRAVLNRLSGFLDAMDAAEHLPAVLTTETKEQLVVTTLTVTTPANMTLVDQLNFTLPSASSLLIRGASGVGKTTLLRAIAGLWPYAQGEISRPSGTGSLFLPQKPYLPLGSLRTCLYYPASAPVEKDARAAEILVQCQLGHLIGMLDDVKDWTKILSLGEQQRLAIGRVLLIRPELVFLDEASSAMDEGLEHAMYQLLRQSLPQTILISVGHRSSLLPFHTQELKLMGGGQWQLRAL